MNKLPHELGYFEGVDDSYLDGVRPDDPPRISLFWIGGAILAFGFVWWAAVHVF